MEVALEEGYDLSLPDPPLNAAAAAVWQTDGDVYEFDSIWASSSVAHDLVTRLCELPGLIQKLLFYILADPLLGRAQRRPVIRAGHERIGTCLQECSHRDG